MPLNPRFQIPAELWISFLELPVLLLLPVVADPHLWATPGKGRCCRHQAACTQQPIFPTALQTMQSFFFPVTFGYLHEVTISREIHISAAEQDLLAQKEWMEQNLMLCKRIENAGFEKKHSPGNSKGG